MRSGVLEYSTVFLHYTLNPHSNLGKNVWIVSFSLWYNNRKLKFGEARWFA